MKSFVSNRPRALPQSARNVACLFLAIALLFSLSLPASAAGMVTENGYSFEMEDLYVAQMTLSKDGTEPPTPSLLQRILLQGITVRDASGADVTGLLVVTDDDGFDPSQIGDYTVTYAVTQNGEVLAQARRQVHVNIPFSTFALDVVTVGGGTEPLELVVAPNGCIGVFIAAYNPTQQYYWGYDYGTVWYINGKEYSTRYLASSRGIYSTTSNNDTGTLGVGDTTLEDGGRTVKTVWEKDGITFTQYVTLPVNARYILQRWTITNHTGEPITGAKLISGGDTYFAGDDYGYGYYIDALNMAYIIKDAFSGMMAFSGDPTTPADHYFVGYYNTGRNYAISGGDLPDTANSSRVDQSYYLQWDYGTIANGGTVEIKAKQEWAPAGYLMITAPNGQDACPGDTVTYEFLLINVNDFAITADLSAVSSNGYAVSIPGGSTVTIPGIGGTALVEVTVQVPAGAANGTTDQLTLTANYEAGTTPTQTSASTITTVKWYTVSFDSSGGTAVASQAVRPGSTAVKPSNPSRAIDNVFPYTFLGWFTADGVAYDFSTPVTRDITLYARWTLDAPSDDAKATAAPTTTTAPTVVIPQTGGNDSAGWLGLLFAGIALTLFACRKKRETEKQ